MTTMATTPSPAPTDYVLGTDDIEVARLGAQHAVWRDAAREAWARAGISAGHTVLDVGCGPGFATLDLAAVVGPTGRVIAVDKSQRYLDHLAARGLAQITPVLRDLDGGDALPQVHAAWARWVFCFLAKPRDLLARVVAAIEPGGVFVAHEYFDYRTWRTSPRVPEIEEYVAGVMASWRASGGEPDIALSLLPWLEELGVDVVSARPIVDVASPSHPKWGWLASFGASGLPRLVELGVISAERAPAIAAAWATLAERPHIHMVTPSLLEVVARKRA